MAAYFMGFSSGTSKKTNEPFWCITLLRQRFGRFVTVPSYFASEDAYNRAIEQCKNQNIKEGTPVDMTVDIDGHPNSIKHDKSVPSLDLRA